MALQLGDTAPNFTASTTEGEIDFYDWKGDSWGILFSHPKDFTPVCTTELGAVARLKPEWDKRNVKVIGLSVDELTNHAAWSADIEETQGAAVNFPIIADTDRNVSDLYDLIHPNASDTLTVRSVFIIGPDNKVKLIITYPASTGRNFDEILRVVDSLQLTAKHKVATPVNWNHGEDVIIVPAVSDEDAKLQYPGGWNAVKPYLRLVPAPTDPRSQRPMRAHGQLQVPAIRQIHWNLPLRSTPMCCSWQSCLRLQFWSQTFPASQPAMTGSVTAQLQTRC